MKQIQTTAAPAAIGPYSQGFIAGDFIWTSGQIPLSPETGALVGATVEAQAEQCLKNLKAILEAAGSSLDKVIKTTCFLTDMKDFAAFNAVYARYMTGNPARSCIAVKALPRDALCEIEAVAER